MDKHHEKKPLKILTEWQAEVRRLEELLHKHHEGLGIRNWRGIIEPAQKLAQTLDANLVPLKAGYKKIMPSHNHPAQKKKEDPDYEHLRSQWEKHLPKSGYDLSRALTEVEESILSNDRSPAKVALKLLQLSRVATENHLSLLKGMAGPPGTFYGVIKRSNLKGISSNKPLMQKLRHNGMILPSYGERDTMETNGKRRMVVTGLAGEHGTLGALDHLIKIEEKRLAEIKQEEERIRQRVRVKTAANIQTRLSRPGAIIMVKRITGKSIEAQARKENLEAFEKKHGTVKTWDLGSKSPRLRAYRRKK